MLFAKVCSDNPWIDFKQCPPINEQTLQSLQSLPDGIRKQIKLLTKQYLILEVYCEPPVFYEMIKVSVGDYVIIYRNFHDHENEFKIYFNIEGNRIYRDE